MARAKKSPDETIDENFDLFPALAAIDAKDYGYFSRLLPEQQRKFVDFMLLTWTSSVDADGDLADYYLRSTDLVANQHYFHEAIRDNPELQWLMLCAASPGMGRQRHSWIPQLGVKKANLSEPLTVKDAREYFAKIGYSAEYADAYSQHQRRCVKLAEICSLLSVEDLHLLAQMVTDEEIEEYYRQQGR